jgi:hypothetical protein
VRERERERESKEKREAPGDEFESSRIQVALGDNLLLSPLFITTLILFQKKI